MRRDKIGLRVIGLLQRSIVAQKQLEVEPPERLSNPYTPPFERGTQSRPVARRAGLVFSAALTLVSSSFCAYFIHAAAKLKLAYPDFHDPSPDVDGYWPGVVYTINIGLGLVAGAFAALCGLVLLAIVFANRRAAKFPVGISHSDQIG